MFGFTGLQTGSKVKHCSSYLKKSTVIEIHAKLEVAGMTQSVSRVGKCIDNGPIEKHKMYLQATLKIQQDKTCWIKNYFFSIVYLTGSSSFCNTPFYVNLKIFPLQTQLQH